MGFEQFSGWVDSNPRALGLSEWLLFPDSNLTLSHSARLDVAPTFYQTLAGVTHLEEQEIAELEKRFWALAQDSSSGLIDRYHRL